MSFNNDNSNNNEQRRVQIVEDLPALRSVMIGGGGGIPAMPLRRTIHEPQFGKGSASAKFPSPIQSAGEAFILEKTASANDDGGSSCRWQVIAALPVPSYYDFERTHARVKGLSAFEVSRRIDNCLRAESMAVSFDNEQAVARAVCAQCVKFAVRLWSSKGDIVVEIQRSSGCSFLFQQIAKKILSAADPSRVLKLPQQGLRSPPPLPRSLPPIPDAEWEANTCEGIEHATNVFKAHGGQRLDAHLLAIESLVHLSEGCKCKQACAKAVLQADGPILPHIVSLIMCMPEQGANSYKDEIEALMRRHAINLLANCLETIQLVGGDDITSLLEESPELTSDEMLHALLREMDVNRPHDAAAACRCLTALLTGRYSSPDLKDRAFRLGAHDAATAVSMCRHAMLETESAKLQHIFL